MFRLVFEPDFSQMQTNNLNYFFFNWYSGREVQLGPLGTAATNRPILLARVIMMTEKLVE
jgi:hypothetical protein